jgi:hypothetical protein
MGMLSKALVPIGLIGLQHTFGKRLKPHSNSSRRHRRH